MIRPSELSKWTLFSERQLSVREIFSMVVSGGVSHEAASSKPKKEYCRITHLEALYNRQFPSQK